jgi:hypothetical protein
MRSERIQGQKAIVLTGTVQTVRQKGSEPIYYVATGTNNPPGT